MQQAKVLICGAGPTGLVLAIWLTKAGVPVRIIDTTAKPGTTSRATVIHARTLEFYHQLGIDRAAIERGINMECARIWVGGREVAQLPFSGQAKQITPYPYILILPQDRHEELLTEELEKLDVCVERSTSLVSFEETSAGIKAQISSANGESSTCEVSYLAGCDGAHSTVRHGLGIEFPGGTYEGMFYVADLKVKGKVVNGDLNAAIDKADFLLVFPMKGEGRVRLIGRMKENVRDKEKLQWDDVSKKIMQELEMEAEEVYWFSTYNVHHRVADRFRKGRAFLLGDAGHIHSPVGGQGMNTGIGDAVNLAWKLAAVIKEGAPEKILDSYEQERIGFARTLVSTTDRAFTFIDKRSALATFIRTRIIPPLLHIAFKSTAVRRAAFLTVSQTRIEYRKSKLSKGAGGKVYGGDRLPWIPQDLSSAGERDNFGPLDCLCWQVHCYGKVLPPVRELCKNRNLPLCVFPYNADAERAGVKENCLYIVRPDGYVGLAVDGRDIDTVSRYLDEWCGK